MKIFFACLLLSVVCVRSASPSLLSFEPTQFDTNTAYIKYMADWTNDFGGTISPITSNYLVTMTNQNVYGTWSTPTKVTLLSLGTNQLDMALQSAWLLNSPTNDATQVILSLSAGAYQGQHAFLLSQNGAESFTLPNYSEQYNVPGAYVILGQTNTSDWIGSTNRGIHLVYSAPDWVIEGLPTDPSVPGGGSTNIVTTVGPGTINTLAMFGPLTSTVTNSIVRQLSTTNILINGSLNVTNYVQSAPTSGGAYAFLQSGNSTMGGNAQRVGLSVNTGPSAFGQWIASYSDSGPSYGFAADSIFAFPGASIIFNGDLLPTSSNTWSLGSASLPWKDLFLSTNSLHLGGNIYTDNGTSLLRNGTSVGGGSNPLGSVTAFSLVTLTTNAIPYVVAGVTNWIPVVTVTP